MAHPRRNNEAALRAAARRQREDEAPRLQTEVPALRSLRLEIDERRGSFAIGGGAHIRRVVVESAPALFVLRCSDRDCKDGGHDVTREIMHALSRRQTSFKGSHECDGQLWSARCSGVLEYVAVATYASDG